MTKAFDNISPTWEYVDRLRIYRDRLKEYFQSNKTETVYPVNDALLTVGSTMTQDSRNSIYMEVDRITHLISQIVHYLRQSNFHVTEKI